MNKRRIRCNRLVYDKPTNTMTTCREWAIKDDPDFACPLHREMLDKSNAIAATTPCGNANHVIYGARCGCTEMK